MLGQQPERPGVEKCPNVPKRAPKGRQRAAKWPLTMDTHVSTALKNNDLHASSDGSCIRLALRVFRLDSAAPVPCPFQ